MATRSKTVEYSFQPNIAGLAATTSYEFPQITLTLPEVAGRVFRSVILEVAFAGNETVATSLTAWLLGIKLGATAFSDNTVTSTPTNTSDQQSHTFTRDVTSYFTSNFGSLPTQTCQARTTITGLPTTNITCKLIITYEFTDTDLLDSGTATSGGATTLTDSGKAWTTNRYTGQYVKITGGTGLGQIRLITSNTDTELTVPTWDTNPDSSSTYEILLAHLKTVRIPIESPLASLTDTLTELGTNQVPDLDDFLPEANKSYKDIFFEITANDGANATTDFQLGMQLDSETESLTAAFEQALQTSMFRKFIWKRLGGVDADMDTTVAHAFKLRSTVTSRFALVAVVLHVTYSYLETESTTIMNSVMIPMGSTNGFAGGSASSNRERFETKIFIEEPTTLTLKQSGVLFRLTANAGQTLTINGGAQSTRAYVFTAGTTIGGSWNCLHRLDSGGGSGSDSFTPARGENTIDVDVYSSSFAGGLHAILYLNYTSGKATVGAEAHNKTLMFNIMQSQSCSNKTVTGAVAAFIPEASYFLNSVGMWSQLLTAASNTTQSFRTSVLSGEGKGEGWESILHAQIYSGAEMGNMYWHGDMTWMFKRYPGDTRVYPYNYMDVESARAYQLDSLTAFWGNFNICLTYHSITRTITGTVSGYTGDGSGITVTLHRTDTGEKLGSATTSAGGDFTFTWYDNTIEVFAAAAQDDNHTGRSKDGVAT